MAEDKEVRGLLALWRARRQRKRGIEGGGADASSCRGFSVGPRHMTLATQLPARVWSICSSPAAKLFSISFSCGDQKRRGF